MSEPRPGYNAAAYIRYHKSPRKRDKLKPGTRVEITLFPVGQKRLATVLYRYPRPEEHHKIRVQRDGIARPETFSEKFLRKLPRRKAALEGE
jgi:hypothetical protein